MNFKLLSKIIELSDNVIKALTTHEFLLEGKSSFKDGAIAEYGWSKDGKSLLARVVVKDHYLVTIVETNAPISCTCTCLSKRTHNVFTLCDHSIAALLTARALLLDSKIPAKLNHKKVHLTAQLREKISSKLSEINSTNLAHEGWELHLIPRMAISKEKESRISMNYSLKRFEEPVYEHQLSHPKVKQVFDALRNNKYDPDRFFKAIKYFSENHSVYFFIDEVPLKINYSDELTMTPLTKFDSTPKGIQVHRLGIRNEVEVDNFVHFGKNLFLDLDNQTIGKISDNIYQENWTIADDLEPVNYRNFNLDSSASFTIPAEVFNKKRGRAASFDLAKPKVLRNFSFFEFGINVQPELIQPHYAITMIKAGTTVTLALNVFIDGKQIPSDQTPFLFTQELKSLFAYADTVPGVPKDFMEKQILPGLIFVENEDQAREHIKNNIQKLPISVNRKLLSDRCLVLFNNFQTKKMAHIIAHEGKFLIVPHDYKKVWLLFAAYYTLLHGNKYSLEEMVFNVDLPQLFAQFRKLKSMLDAQGIGLYLNNKKVHVSKFDVSVDASRSNDIDWFEVKPEIKMDGELISEDEWQQIVAGGGMMEREDAIHFADLDSQQSMTVLARFFGRSRNEGKKEVNQERNRLQIFDLIDLIQNKINVSLSQTDKEIVYSLLNFKCIPATSLANVQATLRDYQKDGYNWLSFLYQHRFGACLADDMGLGKTVQAISFLGGIREERIKSPFAKKAPHLVVVPPNLIFNWSREIQKFYPAFKVGEYIGASRDASFDDVDIVITSYDIVRRDQEKFKDKLFDVIIFDEAQIVKNLKAQKTVAARSLQGNFKLCLTGTPLENNISEYFSIIDLAVPGLLPHEKVLMQEMKEMNTSSLSRTKPFVLRRTKAEILHELPPKTEMDMYLIMTEAQKKVYNKISNEIKGIVDAAYAQKTKAQAGIVALTAILRLRQICISPELVGIKSADAAPKVDYLIDKMHEIVEEGHAALIFSQFLTTFDILEKEFKKEKIPYMRIDGSTPLNKRREIVDAFEKDHKVPILLLSLKVGGVGLNLTRANYVFHVDPWWNPAVENQATDRAHRIGQQNKVLVTRLIMKHSIEEKMMVLKQRKKALFDAIMEGTLDKGAAITKEDFDFLLN